jgi:DNA mismatch repair protein MutS
MIVDEYLGYYKQYQEKYGKNTIVFLQVGSFYESYSYDNHSPDLSIFSEIMNIVYTRKNNSKEDSPYMLGFPCQMVNKYIKRLVNQNYTVVLYKQVQTQTKEIIRVLENIYTPSTYIEDVQTIFNYLLNIYIEKNDKFINIGINVIDLSTGDIKITENHTESDLDNYITSIYNEIKPKECNVYLDKNSNINTYIFSVHKCNLKIDDYSNFENIKYQRQFFSKIYRQNTAQVLDYIGLSLYPVARLALVLGLDFCNNINDKLLNFIKIPQLLKNNCLILGNDADSQLNITTNNNLQYINNRYKCVYDVVNNCLTNMGKRQLLNNILYPYTEVEDIQKILDLTESIEPHYENMIPILKNIKDIERLSRKIYLGCISPSDFYSFYTSIKNIISIYEILGENTTDIFNLVEYIDEHFIIDIMNNLSNIKDTSKTFIKDMQLIDMEKCLQDNQDVYNNSINIFNKLLSEKKTINFEIKETKDGKFINTTLVRGDKIKNLLSEQDRDKYTFVNINKNCRIFVNEQPKNDLYDKFIDLLRKKYIELLDTFYQFEGILNKLSKFVSKVDLCINNCILKYRHGYCQPSLDKADTSYIIAENIRHPVIEKIIETEYITNSIDLKSEKNILLFGINCSGKSSFQKSIGIAVILAQAGCYVPCSSLILSPYQKLYVRLTGNDNIFKGLSSFAVEMFELKNIIDNKGKNTIVVGDELARGTETISALSILGSALIELQNSGTTSIFATHFHDIVNIPEINFQIYHMKVKVQEDGTIEYSRKLTRGKSEDLYGLLVARNIINNLSFVERAQKICNNFLEQKNTILDTKKSRYNSSLFVDECLLCKKQTKLETHHINYQKDCTEYVVKEKKHIGKNHLSNLIIICDKCHDKIHSENKNIKKVDTSKGIKILIE